MFSCSVRHISAHIGCDWCCVCFDVQVSIVFTCLSLPMDHMDCRNRTCRGARKTLQHTCTHTSFIVRIGVCALLGLASTHKALHTPLFLRCCVSHLLCFPKIHPVQTSKFPAISSARLRHIPPPHPSLPPSLPPSQPHFSPEHHLC